MSEKASAEQAKEFAAGFRSLLRWIEMGADRPARNEVLELVGRILPPEAAAHSVVTRELPAYEHVNLQTALNAWSVMDGRTVTVHGLSMPRHYGGVTLQQLIGTEELPPLRLSAPGLVDLPNGPGTTLACLRLALLEVTDTTGTYVLMVQEAQEHERLLTVEVGGLPVEAAQALLASLDALRSALNVYRGQVLEVSSGMGGGVSLTFASLPTITRADVVLPDHVLTRVERHALGMAAHRDALLAAGQHLKRGLLLFGPPGTGKTHTTGYLIGQMHGYTRLLLSGQALDGVGSVTDLARELQPSLVVLEDVDLVAGDRDFGMGPNMVLFELLDAMDGAAADADILFLLTTNRADLLEPALAARPGRVDVAVEIDLPDSAARRRLLTLYGHQVPLELGPDDVDAAMVRTEGVTASFLKELVRRAVLESLHERSPLQAVTAEHLSRALDDLLDSRQQVTRALLGVGGGTMSGSEDDELAEPAEPSGSGPSQGFSRPRRHPRHGQGPGWSAFGNI